ncbi:protein transport protein Sec16A isoform X2 [Armigeres subalbatus]|uniref:protein transport protein Sec16A isoform X2 n=1 Tax=Armigeres subalbatus TaxID=124917 RepID=UPI002ED3D63A
MAEPFSASTAFTNNNNNDGWGDDWGDWGDTTNAFTPQKAAPPQQHIQQTVPPKSNMNTTQYFQTQQQQQYRPQQMHLDQNNRNFMPNQVPTTANQQQMYANYTTPLAPIQQQQQHFQPTYQQHPYPPQQPQYTQPLAPTNFFTQPTQRPPSHPPASVTPNFPQNSVSPFDQTISDSFNSSANDNWNWNLSDNKPSASPKPQHVEAKPPINAVQDMYHQQPSYVQQNTVPQNTFSLPGAGNNTQLPQAKVQPAQLTRLKNETLSPQWSIESQVSQTSSDRSIESGEIGESRSSNTGPSDDGSSGRNQVENYENIGGYEQQYPDLAADKLDMALNSLSIKQEPRVEVEDKGSNNYRESSFPPPPPSIASIQQTDNGAIPPKSSSKTPPLPPPPTEVEQKANAENQLLPPGPPPTQGPLPIQGPPKAALNPFKRTTQRAHIATPGLGVTQPPAPIAPVFYQPPEITNVETFSPENQEIPDARIENAENLEVAPSNDRNQYLQTGHLSEDGYTASHRPVSHDQQQGEDSLPPPGLSRYVPGQQQSENNQQITTHSYLEPPPGLDRMIPGTDLENATDLNMERQADGEVSDSASNPNPRPAYSSAATIQADHHQHREEEISDRNLYLVPGESDTHHNQQRVIPGVEDDRPPQSTSASSYSAQHLIDIPINEQQRELIMDGENPHDPPTQPIHVELSREEPIEGGNTDDDNPVVASTSGAGPVSNVDAESNLIVETTRKDPSNTSTADESDKERSMFYGKGKSSRRDEDPLRRSNKSKSSRDRYDTEDSDYSDRDRRRREREGSANVEQRDRRRGDREKERDRRKDGGKDRDRERDRDYDYRDKEKNRYDRERDRYGRGSKYDRDSRYETDGSKYETERSTRYDKEGDTGKRYMSREEYYRKREERERGGVDDRRYRKEKERDRGDRYRDDRRKDDRYREGPGDKRRDRHDRRYEYEDYRGGSRNGTERDRERDRARESRERDDRKDRKYPPSNYGAQYGATSGYYDPYSYYTQHQQYYEQLRRTNPQAYAEWYRTYYSQMQTAQMQRDLLTSDGRESVHSGRSSANDKERFNRTTPFLHQPGMYNPEDYHRHFNNQSQPSAMLDQSFLSEVSGQPTSLPMYHHQQAMATFQQQQQQQQRATPLIMDRSYHTESGYYQPRLDNTDGSLRQEPSAIAMMEPERLTPRKFPEIHPIVSVSSGLLVTAKNRLTINGTTDLVKIWSLGTNEPTRKLFQSYPGPLVKDKTHKKSVIEFCEEQLRNGPIAGLGHAIMKSRGNSLNSLQSLGSNVNRGSYTLLWNYIILLLRQNGTFVGTDISELLMQNKLEFPFDSHQASVRSANVSGRNSSLSNVDRAPREQHGDGLGDEDTAEQSEIADASVELEQHSSDEKKEQLSELEITDKFRNYLIYGNISDALEWATENNLWGHALFLASKVDSRQHANVMMKFANKLTLNDPLQTLYQLLSGRTPSAVTCVLDEKWGDWRPHLAMLMSNSSAKPELIKKSITTLGDSLYNRGDLYAAHFCYLLSDVNFGKFSDVKPESGTTINANTVVRLVLLGSAHLQRSFKEFSTNESIMMTEIYEYARSLNEERYSISELQFYKYLLACRMLDHGMQLKCLLYMEQIAEQIQQDPYRFDSEFIRKVYTLGDRLKFYDPVLEKALDESVDNTGQGNIYANVEDPAWLQRLCAILTNYNAASYVAEPIYDNSPDYSNYNNYGSGGEHLIEQQSQPVNQDSAVNMDSKEINKEFTEINQQLGRLNLQYVEGYDPNAQQLQQQTPIHHQYDHQLAAPSYDQGYDSINQSSLQDDTHLQQQQASHDTFDQHQQQQQQASYPYAYDGASAQPSMFTPSPVSNQDPQQPSPYDYWNSNAEIPKPSISMPNAVSNRPGFDDDQTNPNASPQHQTQASQQQANDASSKAANAPIKKAATTKDPKAGNNAQGSGWFSWFKLKPKNQMILPDDKNPTIVWDPDKKRWVNTEGDEVGEEAFKPPPKMSDIMPGAAASPQVLPPAAPMPSAQPVAGFPPGQMPNNAVIYGTASSLNVDPNNQVPVVQAQPTGGQAPTPVTAPKVGEPTKVPTLQSNMFKMQRNRTLKKSYVDVFNPSGAAPSRPAEPILAPTVPAMATPQGGFFIPGAAPIGGQPNESAAEGMPQFYNPNQYAGGYQQQ